MTIKPMTFESSKHKNRRVTFDLPPLAASPQPVEDIDDIGYGSIPPPPAETTTSSVFDNECDFNIPQINSVEELDAWFKNTTFT
jgi:hypothetical protein